MLRRTAAIFVPGAVVPTPTSVVPRPHFPASTEKGPQPPPGSSQTFVLHEEEETEADDVELKVCFAHPQVRQHLRVLGISADWTLGSPGGQNAPTYQSPLGFALKPEFCAPTVRELKRAYYTKAMLVHPDAGLSGNSERFVEVADAYKSLLSEHCGVVTRQPPPGYSPPSPAAYPRAGAAGARRGGLWDTPQDGRCTRYDHYCAQRIFGRVAIAAGVVTALALLACITKANRDWSETHRAKRQAVHDDWEQKFFTHRGGTVPELVWSSSHPRRTLGRDSRSAKERGPELQSATVGASPPAA